VNGKRYKADTDQSPAVRWHASRPRVGTNVLHVLTQHYAKSWWRVIILHFQRVFVTSGRMSNNRTILCQNGRRRLICFNYQLIAQFLLSITICMLYYNRHISSINMPIFRRTNCIITTSGIVPLCTVLYSHLQIVTVPDAVIIQFVLLKMGMLMLETCRGLWYTYCYRIKELCNKLVIGETSLYYDARSENHKKRGSC
jgi:hypothetical protein